MTTSSPHVVIAGGGTGGHLFPGLAVAEELVAIDPGTRVTFVGTEEGIEARVIPETPFELELVDVEALKGGSLVERVSSVARLPKSGLQARRLVSDLAPDIVVSVGGYAAGPVTLVAALSGVPTALMEQNSYPGLTNRLLSRVVDRAFVTFEDSIDELGDVEVSVYGNPVRTDLLEEADAYEYASSEGDEFRILIIGGSGGAGSFNEHIPTWMASMGPLEDHLVVRHQAGRGRGEDVVERYRGFAGEVEVVEFIDDMAEAYRWCDLLICRAGASTIAEVLTLGVPAIFVPFPAAADDHQRANARTIVEAGAGVMIDDDELTTDRARNLVTGFVNNPTALENIAAAARKMARPDAGRHIAESIVEMTGEPTSQTDI